MPLKTSHLDRKVSEKWKRTEAEAAALVVEL